MSIISRVARLKTQNFTTSGTFIVPNDVYSLVVSGTGGGGGYSPNGGSGLASGGSGGFTQNFKIPVTPGDTLTITIGAGGAEAAAGGSTIIFSSLTSVNLLVLGGGGPAQVGYNSSVGGAGGYPNGSGGFAQTKSTTPTSLATGGCGAGNGSGRGQIISEAGWKMPGMGKYQSGAHSSGITPFMYGRGGKYANYTLTPGVAGFLLISWVE